MNNVAYSLDESNEYRYFGSSFSYLLLHLVWSLLHAWLTISFGCTALLPEVRYDIAISALPNCGCWEAFRGIQSRDYRAKGLSLVSHTLEFILNRMWQSALLSQIQIRPSGTASQVRPVSGCDRRSSDKAQDSVALSASCPVSSDSACYMRHFLILVAARSLESKIFILTDWVI